MKLSEKANDKVNKKICETEEELNSVKYSGSTTKLVKLLIASPAFLALGFQAALMPALGTILPVVLLSTLVLISEKSLSNAINVEIKKCKQELKHLENMQKDGLKINESICLKKKEKHTELVRELNKVGATDLKLFKASMYLEALASITMFITVLANINPAVLALFGGFWSISVASDVALAFRHKKTQNLENRIDNLEFDIEVSDMMREEMKKKKLISKIETVLDKSKYNIPIPKEIEEYIERLAEEQEESKAKEYIK